MRRQQGAHFFRRVFVRVGQVRTELEDEAIAHQGKGAGVLIGGETIVELGQGATDGGDDGGIGRRALGQMGFAGGGGGRQRGGDRRAGRGKPNGDELIEGPRRDRTGDRTDRRGGWRLGGAAALEADEADDAEDEGGDATNEASGSCFPPTRRRPGLDHAADRGDAPNRGGCAAGIGP